VIVGQIAELDRRRWAAGVGAGRPGLLHREIHMKIVLITGCSSGYGKSHQIDVPSDMPVDQSRIFGR